MYMNLRNVTCIFNIHDEVRTYTRWQHTFIICQSKQHLGLAYPFGSVNFGAPFLSVSLKQPSASCSMERLLRCSILLVVSYHIPQRFNRPVNSLKNCTFSLDTLPAASIKKKIMPMMAWMVGINFIVTSLSLLNMKCILCTISDFLAYCYSYSEAD